MGGTKRSRLASEGLTQGLVLLCLLAMSAWSLIGPSGLLSWSENNHLLADHQKELQQLTAQRDDIKNRVALLDPNHVDPDMTTQLLRSELNVVHPDDKVMLLN